MVNIDENIYSIWFFDNAGDYMNFDVDQIQTNNYRDLIDQMFFAINDKGE